MWRLAVDPNAVGLTPDRWEVLLVVAAVIVFTCGILIAGRF